MYKKFDGQTTYDMLDLGAPTMMRYVVFKRTKNVNQTLASFRYEDQAQMFVDMMRAWEVNEEMVTQK